MKKEIHANKNNGYSNTLHLHQQRAQHHHIFQRTLLLTPYQWPFEVGIPMYRETKKKKLVSSPASKNTRLDIFVNAESFPGGVL